MSFSGANGLLTAFKLVNNALISDATKRIGLKQFPCFTRFISTSHPNRSLAEFFDDKNNWGAFEVKCGRSWRKAEMRLKSNSDLHKLWYILLKERNMLLTMEQAAADQIRLFPSPERLDKVQQSMENLEAVIKERNRAYHELETGETGQRPKKVTQNAFGLDYSYKLAEHIIPKHVNKKWQLNQYAYKHDADVEAFQSKYREQRYITKKRKERRDFNHVIGLLNRFPNMNMEALRKQYPDVDIEKAKRSRKYGGHFVPE